MQGSLGRDVLRVVLAAVGVTALALVSSPGGSTSPTAADTSVPVYSSQSVANCEGTPGKESADWGRHGIVAGPVAVNGRPPPLSSMEPGPRGTLVARMPILLAGQKSVTISVPGKAQNRVGLFYGREASSLQGNRGFNTITFNPCADDLRTFFTGGIRVRGHQAVRLNVSVADQKRVYHLPLGHPEPAD